MREWNKNEARKGAMHSEVCAFEWVIENYWGNRLGDLEKIAQSIRNSKVIFFVRFRTTEIPFWWEFKEKLTFALISTPKDAHRTPT